MLILSNPATPISHPDYFHSLRVAQDADLNAIHAAYHKLAPKYHPESASGDAQKFRRLAEAYTVLSDSRLRNIYETYGYVGLHKGVSAPTFEYSGWSFTADPARVYEDFFGSRKLLVSDATDFSMASPGVLHRSPDVVSELVLSLEQWFAQGVHELPFKRRTLQRSDMRTVVEEESKVRIDLRRANNAAVGCRLVFQGEGHWIHPLSVRGDLVVLVKVARHKMFASIKDSADLHAVYRVTLKQALSGFNAELTGVDGSALVVPVWGVVESGKTLRVPGQGLKTSDAGTGRGDLVLTFKVSFPVELSDEQVVAVKHLFDAQHHH